MGRQPIDNWTGHFYRRDAESRREDSSGSGRRHEGRNDCGDGRPVIRPWPFNHCEYLHDRRRLSAHKNVKLHWQISAGEFFELLRPGALVVSALLSTWVLASARRWRFRFASAIAWALGTFLVPFIVLPIYLIARSWTKRSIQSADIDEATPADGGLSSPVKLRFLLPGTYALVLLSIVGIYIYRDYLTVDAHLARATQAKVLNNRPKAIREYRAALRLEDNPHTHKLLGLELAEAQEWAEALREFRAAEAGGEPDDLLLFHIGQALERSGQSAEAVSNDKKFLNGRTCVQALPDSRCEIARQRIASAF